MNHPRRKQVLKFWLGAVGVIAAIPPVAIADPLFSLNGRPGERLALEAKNLETEVHYSRIGYSGEAAVRELVREAEQLARCECDADLRGGLNSRVSALCALEISGALSAMDETEYELRDDARRSSQLEYQLQDTTLAAEAVRRAYDGADNGYSGGGYPGEDYPGYDYPGVGYPAPIPPPIYGGGGLGHGGISVIGSIDGVSFRFSGRLPVDIDQQCHSFGSRMGIYNVRIITVNGQRIVARGSMTLSDACRAITARARRAVIDRPIPPPHRPIPPPRRPLPSPRRPY